ncbi:MAG: tetratricopeptide repeat protein [Janthinobacterium lividum]
MHASVASLLDTATQHFQAQRFAEAAQSLLAVLEHDPQHADALDGLAHIALRRNDAVLAADYFDRAFAVLAPDVQRLHVAALANQAAGRHARALALFEQELQRAPRDIVAITAIATAMTGQGAHARARQLLERAIGAAPRVWQLHYNLGRVLGSLGEYESEMAAYRRALELKPDCVDAYVNLGVALRDLHRFDEALRMFRKAVQLDAQHAGARTNRAQTNLLLGEFEHGWREYEWRWRDGGQHPPFDTRRLWLGEAPLQGRTLLLHAEQGFGDTLQFVRYTALLAGRGARIVLQVQAALLPLLADHSGVDQVVADSAPVPAFDYHCPLLSLPLALGTRAASIPAAVPYLQADAARSAAWRTWLALPADAQADAQANSQAHSPMRKQRPCIGVAWSGQASHVNDRNRSMALADWLALLACDAAFVSLQKDVRETDRDTQARLPALRDPASRLTTFADTAALIAGLDLVICVDTAVAHLAGALGKPVWVLLPFTPDWRWQMTRDDSPWYPGMRLFRQPARGDWRAVMRDVQAALETFIQTDAQAM